MTFVVTRGMRAAEIARGSAMNAARWLSLASDRPLTKAFGQMLLGFILTANSAGQPAGTRLGVMLVCEACRLGLVAQATLRAGCERRSRPSASGRNRIPAFAEKKKERPPQTMTRVLPKIVT